MAQFRLNWFNTEVITSSNALSQTASYRRKSVGGTWIETGFIPANPLAKSANTTTTTTLLDNVIYEFQVQANCEIGGPTLNSNGIRDGIKMVCIVPNVVSTFNSSTATVNLLNTDISKVRFTLRRASNNAVVYGPVDVTNSGNLAQTLATGLEAETGYYWQTELIAVLNGVEVVSTPCTAPTFVTPEDPVEPEPEFAWIADDTFCEKEGGFGEVKTITGVFSPYYAMYDEPTGRVYVMDADSLNGNVYWFNPITATVPGDMNYTTSITPSNRMYAGAIDKERRKIYLVGRNTGGLIVYDIATDTSSLVPYGANAVSGSDYNRIFIYVSNTTIYCHYFQGGANQIHMFDRLTYASIGVINVASLHAKFGLGGYQLLFVGSKIYVSAGSGSSQAPILVYNSDFSTLLATIPITGAANWDGSKFWQNLYYDDVSNQIFGTDYGSSRMFVIDPVTDTVIYNQAFYLNRQGKTTASFFWTKHPNTNELYALLTLSNSSTDVSRIVRSYKQDRTTFELTQMYKDKNFNGLIPIEGTDLVVSVYPGQVSWAGETQPDGTIIFLSSSVGDTNTGNLITSTLQEVEIPSMDPTGQTKPNIMADPDYIAPAVDLVTCPITFSELCPVDKITTFTAGTLYFEVSIAGAVAANPDITDYQVFAYNTVTNVTVGTPIVISNATNPLLLAGSITGLPTANYTVQVRYRDSEGTVISTCTMLS